MYCAVCVLLERLDCDFRSMSDMNVVASIVDGDLRDLRDCLDEGIGDVVLRDSKLGLEIIRHDVAHILARLLRHNFVTTSATRRHKQTEGTSVWGCS